MTLGVLGGTFDPIHNGHLAAAEAAQAALALDRILLMPSHIPPHRQDPVGASSEQRFAMAALAAQHRPGWSASRIEVDRQGPSYTYDTLVELQTQSNRRIFFILGADAFAEIATWSRYPAVLDLAHFVVVSRPGIALDSVRERLPLTPVTIVEAHTPDISSTDIRRRVRDGESWRGLVPEAVAAYISSHRLYVRH